MFGIYWNLRENDESQTDVVENWVVWSRRFDAE